VLSLRIPAVTISHKPFSALPWNENAGCVAALLSLRSLKNHSVLEAWEIRHGMDAGFSLSSEREALLRRVEAWNLRAQQQGLPALKLEDEAQISTKEKEVEVAAQRQEVRANKEADELEKEQEKAREAGKRQGKPSVGKKVSVTELPI